MARVKEGALIDLIDSLESLDDSDNYEPLVIYAERGPTSVPTSRAIVCPAGEDGSLACPRDASLSEVLMVDLAKEAVHVWSTWRDARVPTREDKFAAVMFYSAHDAFLPTDAAN